MSSVDELLDTLLELQRLDRVPRMGWLLRGVSDAESVSEHSFHTALLTLWLGHRIDGVSVEKAVGMALLHDLAEVRTGDLPLTGSRYLPEGAKRDAETAVEAELLTTLPAPLRSLLEEYHEGESTEARLVKACDKLQLILKATAYERWGAAGLHEFWENEGNFRDGGFDAVEELFEALRCRRRADPERP